MAITLVQSFTSQTSGLITPFTCGFASPTTAGNLIVLWVSQQTVNNYIISDATNGSWVCSGNPVAPFPGAFNAGELQMAYFLGAASISGATAISVSDADVPANTFNTSVVGAEFSGVSTLELAGTAANGHIGTGTSTNPNIAAYQGGALIMAGMGYTWAVTGGASTTYAKTGSWNLLGSTLSTSAHMGDANTAIGVDYLITTASQTYSATLGVSKVWQATLATFNATTSSQVPHASPYPQLLAQ